MDIERIMQLAGIETPTYTFENTKTILENSELVILTDYEISQLFDENAVNEGVVDWFKQQSNAVQFVISLRREPAKLQTAANLINKYQVSSIKLLQTELIEFTQKINTVILPSITDGTIKKSFEKLRDTVYAIVKYIVDKRNVIATKSGWDKFINAIGLAALVDYLKTYFQNIFNYIRTYNNTNNLMNFLKLSLSMYSAKEEIAISIAEAILNVTQVGALLNTAKFHTFFVNILNDIRNKMSVTASV